MGERQVKKNNKIQTKKYRKYISRHYENPSIIYLYQKQHISQLDLYKENKTYSFFVLIGLTFNVIFQNYYQSSQREYEGICFRVFKEQLKQHG